VNIQLNIGLVTCHVLNIHGNSYEKALLRRFNTNFDCNCHNA